MKNNSSNKRVKIFSIIIISISLLLGISYYEDQKQLSEEVRIYNEILVLLLGGYAKIYGDEIKDIKSYDKSTVIGVMIEKIEHGILVEHLDNETKDILEKHIEVNDDWAEEAKFILGVGQFIDCDTKELGEVIDFEVVGTNSRMKDLFSTLRKETKKELEEIVK